MNNNIKVYIISCAYKANKFAINCIESVARQSVLPEKHYYINKKLEYVYTNWMYSQIIKVEYLER